MSDRPQPDTESRSSQTLPVLGYGRPARTRGIYGLVRFLLIASDVIQGIAAMVFVVDYFDPWWCYNALVIAFFAIPSWFLGAGAMILLAYRSPDDRPILLFLSVGLHLFSPLILLIVVLKYGGK